MSNVTDRAQRRRQLRAINNRCELASKDWGIEAANGVTAITTRSRDGTSTVATIAPGAPYDDVEFLLYAADSVFFLRNLYRDALAKIYELGGQSAEQPPEPEKSKPKDPATSCTMLCKQPVFRKFLTERYRLAEPATEETALVLVKSILKITSRTQLRTEAEKFRAWTKLRDEYDAWGLT